jgi:hypothetical protein
MAGTIEGRGELGGNPVEDGLSGRSGFDRNPLSPKGGELERGY